MDEVTFENTIRSISMFAGVIGILLGLDLLAGAKTITALKKILEKDFRADESIAGFFSSIRKALDKPAINIDDKIMSGNAKKVSGILFLFLSVLIILLLKVV